MAPTTSSGHNDMATTTSGGHNHMATTTSGGHNHMATVASVGHNHMEITTTAKKSDVQATMPSMLDHMTSSSNAANVRMAKVPVSGRMRDLVSTESTNSLKSLTGNGHNHVAAGVTSVHSPAHNQLMTFTSRTSHDHVTALTNNVHAHMSTTSASGHAHAAPSVNQQTASTTANSHNTGQIAAFADTHNGHVMTAASNAMNEPATHDLSHDHSSVSANIDDEVRDCLLPTLV